MAIRQISADQSYLTNADGSCFYSQGKTSVLVAVKGPKEVPAHKELLDQATLEVEIRNSTHSKGVNGSIEDTSHMLFVRESLRSVVMSSLHPRTSISVHIQIIKDDGSLLATMINATCLALMDAGISLKCIFSACTCAVLKTNDSEENYKFTLDPSSSQEQAAICSFVFVKDNLPQNQDSFLSSFNSGNGPFDPSLFFHSFELASKGCEKMNEFYRHSAEQKYKKMI